MPRFDVTTFGEGGLRLSVPAGVRLERADSFDIHVAGAEGNVVGALSSLGWQCGWVSGLPKTPMGRRVAHTYKSSGVDLSSIVWRDNDRLSVYYVEYAMPPRPTKVYFDRADSCVNQLQVQDIDWDYLLDTRVIHLTGITVPLSENCRSIVFEAIQRAKDRDVIVSFDVNFRNLLWSPVAAREVLQSLLHFVDILFCSKSDAHTIFGYDGESEDVLAQLTELTSAEMVVMSDSHNGVLGRAGQEVFDVPAKEVGIVDRIGAGDGLVAGVLHGWLKNDFPRGLRYGVIMSALAMSQYGDIVVTTSDELESLMADDQPSISR